MRIAFIDTWGWVNLFNRKERHHKQVRAYYQALQNEQATIVTTDYVLDEVYTLLFKRIPSPWAVQTMESISSAIDMGYLKLVWITPDRFEATKKMRVKFQDKPDISFTDLTSMVVMQELGIVDIITGDAHFTHVGMGFVLCP